MGTPAGRRPSRGHRRSRYCWQMPPVALPGVDVMSQRKRALLRDAHPRKADVPAAPPLGDSGLDRAAERRLTRVRLDLHDGPLQDVALLTGEMSELRKRLATSQ